MARSSDLLFKDASVGVEGPSPRKLKTRRRILGAAAEVVVLKGIGKATVGDVLSAAEVSRRTFYQHFRSKDDVLLALYQQVADGLRNAVKNGAASAKQPVARLHAAIDGYLDYQEAGGELLSLLQAEAVRPDSLLAPYREETLDRLTEFMDKEVRGELGLEIDPLLYRSLFLGMDGLIIHMQARGTFTSSDRARIGQLMQPVYVLILAGGASLPGPP
ncbi:MAG: TetR/AcrR family transcriptional regulator [Myxococcota bacterium]|nr:TetR/AcrR family transcriptional regulator [Myxococcota bacterium]